LIQVKYKNREKNKKITGKSFIRKQVQGANKPGLLEKETSLPSILNKPRKFDLMEKNESESEDSYYEFSEQERENSKETWRRYFTSEEVGKECNKLTKEMNEVDSDSNESSIEPRKSQELLNEISTSQLPHSEEKQISHTQSKNSGINKTNIGLNYRNTETRSYFSYKKNSRNLMISLYQSSKNSSSFSKRTIKGHAIRQALNDYSPCSAVKDKYATTKSIDKKRVSFNKGTLESIMKANDTFKYRVKGSKLFPEPSTETINNKAKDPKAQRKETVKAISININNLNVHMSPISRGPSIFYSTKNIGNESVIGFIPRHDESKKFKELFKNRAKKYSEKESYRERKSTVDNAYMEMKRRPLLNIKVGRDGIIKQNIRICKTSTNTIM